MAYGVKYRLEFSDDEEKGKKIEIFLTQRNDFENLNQVMFDLQSAKECT